MAWHFGSLCLALGFAVVENNNHGMIEDLSSSKVPLERDLFLRTLIRELSGTLQEIVGAEEASGFVSVVGQRMGRQMDSMYKAALQVPRLSREQVKQVCLDLKRRIQGDFYVLEEDEDKIVFGNRLCPFADKVLDRPSMCMMTSNVFGSIAADNLGYAKVTLEKTIAAGDGMCRVVVYLKPSEKARAAEGREYIRADV
jgi:predicted ArsR family transcriptional regulator